MSGLSLKLHFCMFEKWQVRHNSLDCHNFLKHFPLIAKFTCSKFDTNEKCFCTFKALKPQEWTILVFFQMSFFYTKCAPFLWELDRILSLMIKREKIFKLMNYFLIIDLSTFDSKVFLILKIMDFENVHLTKVIHVYDIEGMNAYYTWYKINL